MMDIKLTVLTVMLIVAAVFAFGLFLSIYSEISKESPVGIFVVNAVTVFLIFSLTGIFSSFAIQLFHRGLESYDDRTIKDSIKPYAIPTLIFMSWFVSWLSIRAIQIAAAMKGYTAMKESHGAMTFFTGLHNSATDHDRETLLVFHAVVFAIFTILVAFTKMFVILKRQITTPTANGHVITTLEIVLLVLLALSLCIYIYFKPKHLSTIMWMFSVIIAFWVSVTISVGITKNTKEETNDN